MDPHLALLTYCSTPFPWCNISPAELLMGTHLRANIPITSDQLIPEWTFLPQFRDNNRTFKDRQKQHYDRRHRAQALTPIPEDSDVGITSDDQPISGRVISQASIPRSYVVETATGPVRRNRQHLNICLMVTNQTTKPNSPFENQSKLDHIPGHRFTLRTDCDLYPGQGDVE